MVMLIEGDTGPVMLGDIMLSSPRKPKTGAGAGPTIDTDREIAHQEGYPNGLSQKICLIGENLVIGWSGTHIKAKALFRHLQDRFSDKRADADALRQALDDYGPIDGLQLIGFIREDPTTFNSFDIGASPFPLEHFKKVRIIGAGSSDAYLGTQSFIESISAAYQQTDGIFDSRNRFADTDTRGSALTYAINFVGFASLSQFMTGFGAENLWGAGFEIAYCDPTSQSIVKVDRLMIHGFEVEENQGRFRFFPMPLRTFQWYVGGSLRIVSENVSKREMRGFAIQSLLRDSPVEWRGFLEARLILSIFVDRTTRCIFPVISTGVPGCGVASNGAKSAIHYNLKERPKLFKLVAETIRRAAA